MIPSMVNWRVHLFLFGRDDGTNDEKVGTVAEEYSLSGEKTVAGKDIVFDASKSHFSIR